MELSERKTKILNIAVEEFIKDSAPITSSSVKDSTALDVSTATLRSELNALEAMGYSGLPVCIAKTQYSFSDDPAKLGAPENFTVTVKNVKISAGAGFIVVLTGDIMTMPGLPKVPAAEKIDVDENGKISGLF